MLKVYSREMGQMLFLEGEFMHLFPPLYFSLLAEYLFQRREHTPQKINK